MTLKVSFYVGTHAGLPGVYNRGVRLVDRGPRSHCEMIFSDGKSASASWMDGGVRFKQIDYTSGKWEFLDIPDPTGEIERKARQWFIDHEGAKYDLWGNVRFVVGLVKDDGSAYFCSEAIAAALGMTDSFRYGPNGLAVALEFFVAWQAQAIRIEQLRAAPFLWG